MKKIFTLLVVLGLSAVESGAQQYRMINWNSEYFFTATGTFTPGLVLGLKCDSTLGIAADTVYYPYRTLKQIGPGNTPCSVDPNYPIWAGKEITITSGNHHRWQTLSGDSVVINSQTPIGDTQTVFTYANADRIVAVHISNTLLSFANLSDSVENYTLAVMDTAGNSVSSFWNGKQIIISKENGVVEMPSISNFPNDNSVVTRVAAKRLTYGDCYPWQVGDELHENRYTSGMPPWYISITYNKTILSRTMINPDSAVFTIRRVQEYIANGPPQHYLTIDTITFAVGRLTHYIETAMPQQTIDSLYFYDLYLSASYCGKLEMIDHVMSGNYLDQGCVSWNDFEPTLFDNIYIEGVAGYYFHDFMDPNYAYDIYFHPFYFSMGNISCGTPNYVGMEEETLPAQLKSWPNPATDFISFELPQGFSGRMEIFDSYGKLVQTSPLQKNSPVDVRPLANGFYFGKISSANGTQQGYIRFVKN